MGFGAPSFSFSRGGQQMVCGEGNSRRLVRRSGFPSEKLVEMIVMASITKGAFPGRGVPPPPFCDLARGKKIKTTGENNMGGIRSGNKEREAETRNTTKRNVSSGARPKGENLIELLV